MRISSQGAVISISDDAATPTSTAASAATKAKPTVITIGAPGPAVGDIIVPRGTGWSSIEGRPFKVKAVTGGTSVTLEDSDTTGETAAFPATGATLKSITWVEMCRSTFNMNNPAGTTIPVTTLCDEANRIVPGLPGVGTWAANGFYDVDDLALPIVRDHYRNGKTAFINVLCRDGSGYTFAGTVNVYDVTMGVNAAVATNIGGNVDGLACFYKTPPAGFVPLGGEMAA